MKLKLRDGLRGRTFTTVDGIKIRAVDGFLDIGREIESQEELEEMFPNDFQSINIESMFKTKKSKSGDS